MTIGVGMAITAFIAGICYVAYLLSKRKVHRHKWKQTDREEITVIRTGACIGWRIHCVCEECGEPRAFKMY